MRFGYWQFAFLGDESKWAAEASECAAEQDKFWEYHDYLFEHHAGENQGTFSKENLKKFAVELGLDSAKFDECLDSGRYTSQVEQDTQFASQLGVQSTPTFIVNGKPVVGGQPFETFKTMIESFINQ